MINYSKSCYNSLKVVSLGWIHSGRDCSPLLRRLHLLSRGLCDRANRLHDLQHDLSRLLALSSRRLDAQHRQHRSVSARALVSRGNLKNLRFSTFQFSTKFPYNIMSSLVKDGCLRYPMDDSHIHLVGVLRPTRKHSPHGLRLFLLLFSRRLWSRCCNIYNVFIFSIK